MDECQLFMKRELINFKMFKEEQEAKDFVSNWTGENQLSAIGHGKVWYVCEPNVASQAIEYAIQKTGEILNLNVPLGYDWIVGRNWFECH